MTTAVDPLGKLAEQNVLQLSTYRDVLQACRLPAFSMDIDGPNGIHLTTDSVARIDGVEHLTRRKIMSRLVKRDRYRDVRDNFVVPAVIHDLDLIRASGENPARADLLASLKRIFVRVSSGVVGLSWAQDAFDYDELEKLIGSITRGFSAVLLEEVIGVSQVDDLQNAIEATTQFRLKYYEPALAVRDELIRGVGSGGMDDAEVVNLLPNDLMTLIALQADPRWADDSIALREALALFVAGLGTSARALTWAFDHAVQWVDENRTPESSLLDTTFLSDVLNESLRLHGTPAFLRRVTEDVTLESGISLEAGQIVALRHDLANTDRSVFGEDAAEFRPGRELPSGVYPYGVSFGSGSHMCLGLPLVVGSTGSDGSGIEVLKMLFEAGVERDPDHSPEKAHDSAGRVEYVTYPIILRDRAGV